MRRFPITLRNDTPNSTYNIQQNSWFRLCLQLKTNSTSMRLYAERVICCVQYGAPDHTLGAPDLVYSRQYRTYDVTARRVIHFLYGVVLTTRIPAYPIKYAPKGRTRRPSVFRLFTVRVPNEH